MPIYIRGEDEDTLARLKELGFDAQVVTDDPMGDIIFYIARMNAKLDNLGQLRHLHKIMQTAMKQRSASEAESIYYTRLNAEYDAKKARLKAIYDRMKDYTDLPQNAEWRKVVPPFAVLNPQREADVFRVFQCEVDANYFLYALQDGMVYIKGLQDEPLLLKTMKHDEGSVRLMDL